MLNIALIEPEIPQNTGNIARTCAATGARLHLVKPLGFAIDDAKLKRAGLDYWHLLDITYYDSLDDFLCHLPGPCTFFSSKAPRAYTEVRYPQDACLVFGKETAGLPEDLLLAHADATVRLPMRAEARCLNLSNAVAVGAYEVLRQWEFSGLRADGELTRHTWPARPSDAPNPHTTV
ncbi:MAG: tRNA (cytidine(34)-2'-O)-methyltransferase [Ethanoligenens sp.]